ncbi:MAG: arylesterase [Xanthomonadales bacterium]|nr:arylesterase [Xanthomonadales bacterium]
MRSVSAWFIIFALSLSCAARAGDEGVILVLGDSLSAAYEMKLDESWPSLLQNRLTEDGYAYRVFNSSIAGDTTQGGLSRLPRLLAENHPQVVIIELGGNDGLRGLSPDVTRANLQSMITQSLDSGARVVLAGIQLPPNYGKTYSEKFSAMYRALATEQEIQFIPFLLQGVALDPALMRDDGIHPIAEAQPILLDTVWQALEPIL